MIVWKWLYKKEQKPQTLSTDVDVARTIYALNKEIYNRGWNTLRDGNISVLQEGRIIMTPSKYKNRVETNHHLSGCFAWPLSETPHAIKEKISSEWEKHVKVYRDSFYVKAIIHCHAPHATALASHTHMPTLLEKLGEFSEFQFYDKIPVVHNEIMLDSHHGDPAHTIICPYHGVTAFGSDLSHAFERLERLEHYAKIVLLSATPTL